MREVIAARGLDAVRPDLSTWPWSIRVLTLGRFQIELEGRPLSFGGKVALKPLERGRLGLSPKLVWRDSLAFEQLVDAASVAALAVCSGHFLHRTEDEPWQRVCRSRLASEFKRTVGQLARHGVAIGDNPSLRTLLERALELDPLAEDLAPELMRLLIDAGEQAAALNVYEHCRDAMARGLNAKPAAATLALVQRIRSMA